MTVYTSPNAFKPCAVGMPDEEENRLEVDHATKVFFFFFFFFFFFCCLFFFFYSLVFKVLEGVLIPTFAKEMSEIVNDRGLGLDLDSPVHVNQLLHE